MASGREQNQSRPRPVGKESGTFCSWFHADRIGRWEQFREKYLSELSANPNAAEFAREMASKPTVTLLYASRDESRNNAAILREYLQKH